MKDCDKKTNDVGDRSSRIESHLLSVWGRPCLLSLSGWISHRQHLRFWILMRLWWCWREDGGTSDLLLAGNIRHRGLELSSETINLRKIIRIYLTLQHQIKVFKICWSLLDFQVKLYEAGPLEEGGYTVDVTAGVRLFNHQCNDMKMKQNGGGRGCNIFSIIHN